MPVQGPLVVVAENVPPGLVETLGADGAFPIVESTPHEASGAITAAKPGAILLADAPASRDEKLAAWLAQEVTALAPIVPVVACASEAEDVAYREALPVGPDATPQFVAARLSAALRARSLHGSVLRRAATAQADGQPLPDVPRNDPLDDATVIVAGRGRSYPALVSRDRRSVRARSARSASKRPPAISSRATPTDSCSATDSARAMSRLSSSPSARTTVTAICRSASWETMSTLPDVEFPNIVDGGGPGAAGGAGSALCAAACLRGAPAPHPAIFRQ